MKEDSGVLREIDKVRPDIFTCQVQDLKPGKKYQFEVLAENEVGYGDAAETKLDLQKKSG